MRGTGSATGELLASAGDDRTVRVWNPATGHLERVLEGYPGRVYAVCAVRAGDRELLASAGIDRTVRVGDPAKAAALLVIRSITKHSP